MIRLANPAQNTFSQVRVGAALDSPWSPARGRATAYAKARAGEPVRPMEPSPQAIRLLFRRAPSGVQDKHPLGFRLIAFLIPKSKIDRLTLWSLLLTCRRRIPEGRNAVENTHARSAYGRCVFRRTYLCRHSCATIQLHSSQRRLHGVWESASTWPRGRPAVAIPFSKFRGLFPLTDVHSRRENSVPTCKKGNLRSEFEWARRARISRGGWALIARTPGVRTQCRKTGGLR
jgi:hypothetical protein